MKITKGKLKQIIKEELEVVLTNEEVEEMFGEEVRAQVEAMESKEITKEAIMEEIQSDPALLDAIGKLTDSIDGLDVSIDFLAFLVVDPILTSTGSSSIGTSGYGTSRRERETL